MSHINLRPAIAMIELIFAIVVMGIVMMSAPMLISTASQGAVVALQQESISQAVAEMNIILTHPWDQNNTDNTCIPPVLHVTNGDTDLNMTANMRRAGVPTGSTSHTFLCNSVELNASLPLGLEVAGITDDMDDFNGTVLNVIAGGVGGRDYLYAANVNIAVNVQYTADTSNYNSTTGTITYNPVFALAVGSTNIKAISVRLTSNPGGAGDASLDSNITLNAFSCNVGGFEYAQRTMP